MKRTNWAKNKVEKKPPSIADVFHTLDGTIWHPKIWKEQKYKINYIIEDRFLMEPVVREINEKDGDECLGNIILDYEIEPEYEDRLYDAVYMMRKAGFNPPQKEVQKVVGEVQKVVKEKKIDDTIELYEKFELSNQEQDEEDELLQEMADEEDEEN